MIGIVHLDLTCDLRAERRLVMQSISLNRLSR